MIIARAGAISARGNSLHGAILHCSTRRRALHQVLRLVPALPMCHDALTGLVTGHATHAARWHHFPVDAEVMILHQVESRAVPPLDRIDLDQLVDRLSGTIIQVLIDTALICPLVSGNSN